MHYLFFSEDDGEHAYQAAIKKVVHRIIDNHMLHTAIPGRVILLGKDEKDHHLYYCGVGKSSHICQLAWIHALEQAGKTSEGWHFIKVTNKGGE